MSFRKSLKNFTHGLKRTATFWKPKSVMKGARQQWSSSKADPLGYYVLSPMLSPTSASTLSSTGSSTGIYGHTGSIVGKY